MDSFVDYLPLIIFALFILRAIFRRPKPQQQATNKQQVTRTTMGQQPPAPTPAPSQATPFEDLVRRIEAAAAEAARQGGRTNTPPSPPRAPAPTLREIMQASKPTPPPIQTAPRLPPRVDTEFHLAERMTVEPEFHQVERTAAEPEFHPSYGLTPEQEAYHESHRAAGGPAPSAHMPSGAMPSRDMPGSHLHDPRKADQARRVHPMVATLMTPHGMRTAFVLKEVLGERRGNRQGRRR